MGHYRPRRPTLDEDPMKVVEVLNDNVEKIKRGKCRGFSKWAPGIPTPEVHAQRRVGRLRALNRGAQPRVGVSLNEARTHFRNIDSMVKRIENLHSRTARSKDSANVNMHPVLLRRRVTQKKKQDAESEPITLTPDKKKRRTEWSDKPVIHRFRTTRNDQPLKELQATQYPNAIRKHRPGEVAVREGTPLCFTPKPHTKLIDGTHLCDRYRYVDSESRRKFFSGSDIDRLKKDYKEVIANPQGLSTLITKPWKAPPPPVSTYEPDWRIDMRLDDLPSDLQATPNRHTLDDPLRPSSSRELYHNVLDEPIHFDDKTPRSATLTSNGTQVKDLPTTPTRQGCSSLKHVHIADMKQTTTDTEVDVKEEMNCIVRDTGKTLPWVEGAPLRWPQGHQNLPYLETQSPVSTTVRPESPISGVRPQTANCATANSPASTTYGNSDLEEGEILAKYKPTDDPVWKWISCCSTPY